MPTRGSPVFTSDTSWRTCMPSPASIAVRTLALTLVAKPLADSRWRRDVDLRSVLVPTIEASEKPAATATVVSRPSFTARRC